MKVGIIGHSGFLGRAFFDILSKNCEVIPYDRNCDLDTLEKCDVIINANGNSSKILAEQDPYLDFMANATFTLAVTLFATKNNIFLVHISSGEASGVTNVNVDTASPIESLLELSNYGLSKAVGEVLVQKYGARWIIIRPSGLIGQGMKKGPVFDLLNGRQVWINEKSKLSLMRTSTTARVTFELLQYHLATGVENQTYDVVGTDPLTLREIAQIFRKELRPRAEAPIVSPATTKSILLDFIKLPTTLSELTDFITEDSHD
jgi:dTDP-4-dehydrorhamnose reductase